MIQAAAMAEKVVERIKGELSKLRPILDMEVVREPQASRTEDGLTLAN